MLWLLILAPALAMAAKSRHRPSALGPALPRRPGLWVTEDFPPLNIVVGLPEDEGSIERNPFALTIAKARPVFDTAIHDIEHKYRIMKESQLMISYENTNLSDSWGPQLMVNRYCGNTVDAIMGPAYVFGLAPIARMSQYWRNGVPVFTTTAMVDELGQKENFPLLTR